MFNFLRKKTNRNTNVSSYQPTSSKEANEMMNWAKETYQISLKAKELYDSNSIPECKALLEAACFIMSTDIPSHYSLLAQIYKDEDNITGLRKLKESVVVESKKERNSMNGSDKKFNNISLYIDFNLNIDNHLSTLKGIVEKNPDINKKRLLDLLNLEFKNHPYQVQDLYELALEKEIINRKKISNRYTHSIN